MSTARRRKLPLLAPFLAMAMLFAACGGGDDTESEPAAEEPAAEEPAEEEPMEETPEEEMAAECEAYDEITIAFFSTLKVGFLPTVIADEVGFFEEFCIEATIELVGTGLNTLQAVQAGEAHLGVPGTPSVINAVSAGSPIKAIWAPAAVSTQAIVATEGITECSQLEGQTVATDGPGGQAHHVMEMFLDRTCGLDIATDVEHFIGTPGDFAAVLAGGTAQAAPQHADDVAVIENEFGIELNSLGLVAEFAPEFAYQTVVVQQANLDANPDLYERVVAAYILAGRWLHPDAGNRDEALSIAAELSGPIYGDPARDESVYGVGYDAYAENFPRTCAESYPEESIAATIALQDELGNLEADVTFDDVIDLSICEAGEALADAHS